MCCLLRGLTVDDLDKFTIAFLLDYIKAYDQIRFSDEAENGKKETVRIATQKDFDNF